MKPLHTPGWHADEFRKPSSLLEPDYYELELRGGVSRLKGPAMAKMFGFGALFILAGWAALTSIYILLHDDLLSAALQDRRHLQAGYEERIAGLRGEIGVITGQLMLNEDEFDIKVGRIRERQALLESRHNQISTLAADPLQVQAASLANRAEEDITGSTTAAHQNHDAATDAQGGPISAGTIRLVFPADDGPRTVSRLPFTNLAETGLPARSSNRADRELLHLASRQNLMETEQFATLLRMETNAETAVQMLTSAIVRIGITPRDVLDNYAAELASANDSSRIGIGPMPIAVRNDFDLQIQRIRTRLRQADSLYNAMLEYPIHRPLPASRTISSRYGSRLDPINRNPSFHGGIDFRAGTGTPIQATADGEVTKAGRSGGYGKVVEIRHSSGLSTRYAHMSAIDVRVGQQVSTGDIVGKVGSTGRSTGPHLHYEIRRNGSTIDPMRFMQTGDDYLVN